MSFWGTRCSMYGTPAAAAVPAQMHLCACPTLGALLTALHAGAQQRPTASPLRPRRTVTPATPGWHLGFVADQDRRGSSTQLRPAPGGPNRDSSHAWRAQCAQSPIRVAPRMPAFRSAAPGRARTQPQPCVPVAGQTCQKGGSDECNTSDNSAKLTGC